MIVVELVGEPRGKGRPRFSRRSGVAYTPEPTRNYEAALRIAAQQAMAGQPPLGGAVMVRVEAYMGIPQSWPKARQDAARNGALRPTKRPDVDNLIKGIDSLNAVVWRDDSQVVTAVVLKHYSDRPRLRIEVQEIGA